MEPEESVEAVKDLYFYKKTGTAGGFTTLLFDLIHKADPVNIENIRKGFPYHVSALERWNEAGNMGDDLFLEYGLLKQ